MNGRTVRIHVLVEKPVDRCLRVASMRSLSRSRDAKEIGQTIFERVQQPQASHLAALLLQIDRKRLRISILLLVEIFEYTGRSPQTQSQFAGLVVGQQDSVRHGPAAGLRDFEQRPVSAIALRLKTALRRSE